MYIEEMEKTGGENFQIPRHSHATTTHALTLTLTLRRGGEGSEEGGEGRRRRGEGRRRKGQETSYLKKAWCSTHTFHSFLAALYLGSLKPMALSYCST